MTKRDRWRRRLERGLVVVGVLCLGVFAFATLEAKAIDLYQGWRLDRALAANEMEAPGGAAAATASLPEPVPLTERHDDLRSLPDEVPRIEKPRIEEPRDENAAQARTAVGHTAVREGAAPEPDAAPATLPGADPAPRTAEQLAKDHTPPEPTGGGDLVGRLRVPRLGMSSIVLHGIDSRTLRRAVGHVPGTAHPGEPGNIALAGHRDTFFRDLRHVREDDIITFETPTGTLTYRVETLTVVPPEEVSVLADHGDDRLTLITCYPFHFIGRAPLRFIVTARPTAGSAEA